MVLLAIFYVHIWDKKKTVGTFFSVMEIFQQNLVLMLIQNTTDLYDTRIKLDLLVIHTVANN